MQGILADVHIIGPVEDLVREMQSEPWGEFWQYLGLALFHFEDVGLTPTSTDLEIWQRLDLEMKAKALDKCKIEDKPIAASVASESCLDGLPPQPVTCYLDLASALVCPPKSGRTTPSG